MNKLFNTVYNDNETVESFKQTTNNIIGFVSNETDEIGYIICNGTQYGISSIQYTELKNGITTSFITSDPTKLTNEDFFNSTRNNGDYYGYKGTLNELGIDGDEIIIDNVSVYTRGGRLSPNINTKVYCRVLKYNGENWEIIYQSKDKKSIGSIEPERLFTFKVFPVKNTDGTPKNQLLKPTDIIAVVYVDDENSNIDSMVQLGFKVIQKNGGLKDQSFDTNIDSWCPALSFGYLPLTNKEIITNITYNEILELKRNSKLIPGKKYRIIDYVTTTVQENTESVGHPFDIIVDAIGVNEINENATACLHENDTYFSNSDLYGWEIKYSLENDTNRFSWADDVNGKGVIYYMKDEFDNQCPYDFKNIKFIYNADWITENSDWVSAVLSTVVGSVTFTQLSLFTFSYYDTQLGIIDDSLQVNTNHYAHGNKINNYFNNADGKLTLNRNVFVTTLNSPYDNIIGNNGFNSIFGDMCYENEIGFNSTNNIIGNKFYDNKIGNGFKNNKIYNINKNSWVRNNEIGSNCQFNIFPRQFVSCKCGDDFVGNDFLKDSIAPTVTTVKNCIFGNSFKYNSAIYYNLSNIEILHNTLSYSEGNEGNWDNIIVNNGKSINKCLSDVAPLGAFKIFIGVNEIGNIFLEDFNIQGICQLGNFNDLREALQYAATVEIAGIDTLNKLSFTVGEIDNSLQAQNSDLKLGFIEQYVYGNYSTQIIIWDGGFRMRKIFFTDNSRTEIDETKTTEDIKNGEDAYWSNPTSLYYDDATHTIALTRFDDAENYGLTGCFGGIELPLVNTSNAGLMSVADKSLLTDTSSLLNKFVKSKVYNSLPNYAGGDWYSHKRYWYRFAKINDKSPNIFRISTNAANDVIFTSSIGWSNGSSYDVTGALSVINSSLNSNENHACIEGIRLVASSSGGYIDMLLNTPYSNSSGYVEIYVTCISTIFNNNGYEPLYNTIEKLEEKGAAFERNGETIVQSFELVDKTLMSKDVITINDDGTQQSINDTIKNLTSIISELSTKIDALTNQYIEISITGNSVSDKTKVLKQGDTIMLIANEGYAITNVTATTDNCTITQLYCSADGRLMIIKVSDINVTDNNIIGINVETTKQTISETMYIKGVNSIIPVTIYTNGDNDTEQPNTAQLNPDLIAVDPISSTEYIVSQ